MVKNFQVEVKLQQFYYIGLECAWPHWEWLLSVAEAAEVEARSSVCKFYPQINFNCEEKAWYGVENVKQ